MALAIPSVSGIWLVDLADVSELQHVNQEITFQQQSSVDHSLIEKSENFGTELAQYYQRMNQNRVAIMQEHVIARNLNTILYSKSN